MNTRFLSRLAIFALIVLVLTSVLTAAAAANVVPVTRADDLNLGARTADQLKPPECTMALTNIVSCPATGTCTGTGSNDLILDTSAGHTINAGAGADCVLGGGGNDTINGQGGNDILLGGDGNDTLNGGAGTDICYGGPGTDTFNSNCETQIP
jgi:Ca2+-binding RTX toxin-like protein